MTGTGFTGATAVRFGATAAPSFTAVSGTQITAATPSVQARCRPPSPPPAAPALHHLHPRPPPAI
ncbi:hypothetical protein [Streptomyces sp. TE3672]